MEVTQLSWKQCSGYGHPSSSACHCCYSNHTVLWRRKRKQIVHVCKRERERERASRTSEGEMRRTLLLRKRVNKRLLELSASRLGVFTASVSITNKSRPPPSRRPSAASLYWEQQIKGPSIWVLAPIIRGSCQARLEPVEKAGVQLLLKKNDRAREVRSVI